MIKLVVAVMGCVIALVALLGGWLVLAGVRNVQRAAASVKWPRVDGTVVRSDTSRNVTVNRETRDASVTYSTKTVVRYTVNGKEYTTDVVHFGQALGSGDPSEAELQRLRYPAGARVGVSYLPDDPAIATVRPGLNSDAFWLIGAGLAFLLPAAMSAIALPAIFRFMSESRSGAGMNAAMAVVAAGVAAIFCMLGVLALSSGILRMWRGSESRSWPSVEGVVRYSKMTGDDNGEQSYSARFVYQYEVDGGSHLNNLRRFGRVEGKGAEWAREIAERYPEGAKVRVAYFPADPDVSVLEPGNDGDALWLPGIGLVALLLGIAAFIWMVPAIARAA